MNYKVVTANVPCATEWDIAWCGAAGTVRGYRNGHIDTSEEASKRILDLLDAFEVEENDDGPAPALIS